MAHRIEMDDWPMWLVEIVEQNDRTKVDTVFSADELKGAIINENVDGLYYIHAHKRSGVCAGMLFAYDDNTVYKPERTLQIDALLETFSIAVHEHKLEVNIFVNGEPLTEEQEPDDHRLGRDEYLNRD